MNKHLEALQNVGLSEKEARVYLTLLEMGTASAYAIAEKSGIKRPTTYVILDELRKKGLVLKIPKAKKRNFVAKSPQEFFRNQELKVQMSKQVLPELISIAGNPERKVKVLYYEGLKGIDEAISYGCADMHNKEIVGFFATAERISPDLLPVLDSWEDKLLKHGIKIRGITPHHSSTKESLERDLSLGHNIQTVPYSEYSSTVSIDAGDTFVRIVMNGDLQAVVIENPDVAKTMKEIFEMVWKKNGDGK